MLNVTYHWDKLDTCIVGRCYPPDFFSFIDNIKIRVELEKIAQETIEDLDKLSNFLQSFGVTVLRPILADNIDHYVRGCKILPPPITPRDYFAMVGDKFFMPTTDDNSKWNQLRGIDWPKTAPKTQLEFNQLENNIKQELLKNWSISRVEELYNFDFSTFKNIENYIKKTNQIVYDNEIDSAMVLRMGSDLYFGSWPWQKLEDIKVRVNTLFPEYNCTVIDTQGHLDGTMSVVTPGLILSSKDIDKSMYNKLFPDYEILYLDNTVSHNKEFFKFKKQHHGKWWIKGQENNKPLIEFIDAYLDNWTGLVEETTSTVNVLHIDKHNIICTNQDSKTIKKLNNYGVNVHLVELRHFHFWDSGIHCLTNDINRL